MWHPGANMSGPMSNTSTINQRVVRIGKEGGSAVRCGPPRRRIGRCNELGYDLGCRPERGIIENGQILLDRAACRFLGQTRGTFNAGAVAGIGLDRPIGC